jgi:NADP-dependent 3-hydroxy acid dehydrogenase YdfG
MQLEAGQVAVVTGAASGLGLAFAEAFAERGLNVVLADVEAEPLATAVKGIEATGAPAIGVTTDVRFEEQLDALATATLDRFGRVDLICNNAGVSSAGRMWEIPPNDWKWVLSVNLGGVINGIRAFVPHLVAQNSGHVVNTASMAGVSILPRHGPYVASKHAVVALSDALAVDLAGSAPNVGVTVVCPGIVETQIHMAERNRPEDLAVAQPGLTGLSGDDLNLLIESSSTMSGPPMSAKDAAAIVLRAIESNKLHVAPNGTVAAARAWVNRLLTDLEAD